MPAPSVFGFDEPSQEVGEEVSQIPVPPTVTSYRLLGLVL